MEVIYNESQLREKCAEWQKILRLQDWDIATAIERKRDLDADDSLATIRMFPEKKMAKVKLLDPVDYMPDSWITQDMELSLVHELLHIHLLPLKDEDGCAAEEQAIEAISRALVGLYRKGADQTCSSQN